MPELNTNNWQWSNNFITKVHKDLGIFNFYQLSSVEPETLERNGQWKKPIRLHGLCELYQVSRKNKLFLLISIKLYIYDIAYTHKLYELDKWDF